MRRKTAGALAALTLMGGVAAGPLASIAQADYSAQWISHGARIAQINGKKYAEWQCTLGGTVLAAGIFWVWLTPVAAIGATLAGGSFTAGCEFAGSQRPTYYSGVPVETRNICWIDYPRGVYSRRFLSCIV